MAETLRYLGPGDFVKHILTIFDLAWRLMARLMKGLRLIWM